MGKVEVRRLVEVPSPDETSGESQSGQQAAELERACLSITDPKSAMLRTEPLFFFNLTVQQVFLICIPEMTLTPLGLS